MGILSRLVRLESGVTRDQHLTNVDKSERRLSSAQQAVRDQVTPPTLAELSDALRTTVKAYTERVGR